MLMKHFYTTALSLVLFCILIGGSATSAKTWTVDDDGPADFSKIQDAVDAASHGDTIIVKSGTYKENVVIAAKNRLTLKGIDYPIVDAGGHGNAITVGGGACVIDGFYATGSEAHMGKAGIAVLLTGGHVIKNNICNFNKGDGIWIYSSSDNTIVNNNVSNNDMLGIGLYSSSHNIIMNNTANHNDYCGISLDDNSFDNTITNNIASNNAIGIFLGFSSNNTIMSNNASNNQQSGIDLTHSSNNMVMSNNFNSNSQHGICLMNSRDNMIINNTALNNWKKVYSYNSYNNVIEFPTPAPETGTSSPVPQVTPTLISTPEITSIFPTTPQVTPKPTPTAQMPTPTPPGFEAVFAIAGLLAVTYILRRRK